MRHNIVNMAAISIAVGYGAAALAHPVTADAGHIDVFGRKTTNDTNKQYPQTNGGLPVIFPKRKAGDVLSFLIPAGTYPKAHAVVTNGAQAGAAPPHVKAIVAADLGDGSKLEAANDTAPGANATEFHTHGSARAVGAEIGAAAQTLFVLVLQDGDVALELHNTPEK